jgi:flavodoxin
MKILVTFWSQTGNTKKVAEAIFGALHEAKEIKPFDEIDTLDGFDLTFLGFPVMQFGAPVAVQKFISAHCEGKKIALFVTHAMRSESEDPQQKAMLEKEMDKCRSAFSKADLVGMFHCQGELSEKIARELLASKIPMLMQFAGMRPATTGHPDQQELEQAGDFARKILSAM